MSHLLVHHGLWAKGPPLCPTCSYILAKGLAPLMYIFCTYSKLYTIFQRITFYQNFFFSFPCLYYFQLSTRLISKANESLPRSVARRRKRERQRSLSESVTGRPVHLYSTHTFNSTDMGVARVREKLHPQRRYTYCQEYHSMAVVPIDIQAQQRAQRSTFKILMIIYMHTWRWCAR